jgi:hypothetical protein
MYFDLRVSQRSHRYIWDTSRYMYLGRFLGVALDTYQDTSRYIKIHVSWTLTQGVVLDELVRFPDGGWAGRFCFLCCMAVLDVVATPLEGGGPTLPLWGRLVT